MIPPRHVEASSLQQDTDEPDHAQWPSLNPNDSKEESTDEWEMVSPTSPSRQQPAATVTFHPEAILASESKTESLLNPKMLQHSQSSPDFRHYVLSEIDDEDSEADLSAVLIEDTSSIASSSMVMVAGPASVWSVGSSARLSFRDAMLQQSSTTTQQKATGTTKQKIRKVKPKFVVKPIQRCSKSTGDLRSLAGQDENNEVMGDTDAHEYYSRKAQGSIGRKNGMKTRPDEAKRLQITMAKKSEQRQRQAGQG
jgi:hypothetical protein